MNGRSSGLHSTPLLGPPRLLLNFFASKTRTLGRTYRLGLLPYPRSMSSSLAPEWIEVRVKRRLKLTLLWLLLSSSNGCQLLELRLRFSRLDRFRNDRLVFITSSVECYPWHGIFGVIGCRGSRISRDSKFGEARGTEGTAVNRID